MYLREIAGRTAVLAFSIVLAGNLTASAQPLDSLVRAGVERHPSLESVRLAAEQAEFKGESLSAWSPPRAGVEMRMLPPLNPNPFSRGETMFMVEQDIPLFGQKNRMGEAAKLEADVRRQEHAVLERELRSRITSLYYRAWAVDRRRELNRENRQLAELLYDDATTRFELDRGSQTDLYRLGTEIEELNATLRSLNRERESLQGVMNALLLHDAGDTLVIVDSVPVTPLPPFASLLEGLNQHPALRKMEESARMSEAQAVAAESQLDPMLMLRGGVALMPQGHPARMGTLENMVGEINRGGSPESETFGLMAGAMLSIPIAPWSRSGPEAQAESARLQGKRALADRETVRQELIADLRRAYDAAEQSMIWIEHYRDRQIPLLMQTLETLRSEYINGGASVTSLIETYGMLVDARERIIKSRMEYGIALVQIERIAGE